MYTGEKPSKHGRDQLQLYSHEFQDFENQQRAIPTITTQYIRTACQNRDAFHLPQSILPHVTLMDGRGGVVLGRGF